MLAAVLAGMHSTAASHLQMLLSSSCQLQALQTPCQALALLQRLNLCRCSSCLQCSSCRLLLLSLLLPVCLLCLPLLPAGHHLCLQQARASSSGEYGMYCCVPSGSITCMHAGAQVSNGLLQLGLQHWLHLCSASRASCFSSWRLAMVACSSCSSFCCRVRLCSPCCCLRGSLLPQTAHA